jgi:secernin
VLIRHLFGFADNNNNILFCSLQNPTKRLFWTMMMAANTSSRPRTVNPLGCDTFVAFPPTSLKGLVVFGKNSDRPAGEKQSIKRYQGAAHTAGSTVQCTYISIPQANTTHAVLLSQIDWMWGAEHGTNEHGVVIGNEAVWTVVEDEDLAIKRLLGMDLVRLGLERGSTAKEALDNIVSLLENHGQGGPCAENDSSITYHNSFLIADFKEAWILETAGRHWVAERVTHGGRNISNNLTIRTKFDLHSKGLQAYAQQHLQWDETKEPLLDWAKCFGGDVDKCESPYSRQGCGRSMLQQQQHDSKHTFNHRAMMDILRDHASGICMHGDFETNASMVSELRADSHHHWMMETPHPCQNEYIKQVVVETKKA